MSVLKFMHQRSTCSTSWKALGKLPPLILEGLSLRSLLQLLNDSSLFNASWKAPLPSKGFEEH
jgi:hypothetical protein